MAMLSVFTLAVGLAMDATAVAAARGMATPRVLPRHVVAVAVWFGGAQALMPWLGWWLGRAAGPYVAAIDHWIAFALLAVIGGKMLFEAARVEADAEAIAGDPFAPRTMFLLALATSIDAFAAGITLPTLRAPIGLSLLTIGLVTAALSALGLTIGRRAGARFGRRLEMFGGVILIALGIKVLAEHLFV